MAKTREELEALKKEASAFMDKLVDLSPEEIKEVMQNVNLGFETPEVATGEETGGGIGLLLVAVSPGVFANTTVDVNTNVTYCTSPGPIANVNTTVQTSAVINAND